MSRDPFTCIDATAVGKLIVIAVESARKQRSDMKVIFEYEDILGSLLNNG